MLMQYLALMMDSCAENSNFIKNMQYRARKSLVLFIVAPILHRISEKPRNDTENPITQRKNKGEKTWNLKD